MGSLYDILSRPAVYNLAMAALAPGAEGNIVREIAALLAALPRGEPILDVGCGPRSWLDRVGIAPVGLDVDPAYVRAYRARGGEAHQGSADALPFPDRHFAGVWCVGVLHHVDDRTASRALGEMLRVCLAGGYVAVMDAVLPRSALVNPLASAIRYLDRGRHMRTEAHLRGLFPNTVQWRFNRFRYASTGLEMLSCVASNALQTPFTRTHPTNRDRESAIRPRAS